jgi:Peptidase family S49
VSGEPAHPAHPVQRACRPGRLGPVGRFPGQVCSAAKRRTPSGSSRVASQRPAERDGKPGRLTPEARGYVQGRVDDAYDLFVTDVALGRRTSPGAVQRGYGRMLTARDAVKARLADRVAPSQHAFDPFEKQKLGKRSREWIAVGNHRGGVHPRDGVMSAGDQRGARSEVTEQRDHWLSPKT